MNHEVSRARKTVYWAQYEGEEAGVSFADRRRAFFNLGRCGDEDRECINDSLSYEVVGGKVTVYWKDGIALSDKQMRSMPLCKTWETARKNITAYVEIEIDKIQDLLDCAEEALGRVRKMEDPTKE